MVLMEPVLAVVSLTGLHQMASLPKGRIKGQTMIYTHARTHISTDNLELPVCILFGLGLTVCVK